MTGRIALSIDELIKPTGEHIIMSSYSLFIYLFIIFPQ